MVSREAPERRIEHAGKQLEAQYRLLESLEGYKRLSERQQNVIRGSLVVQQMWEKRMPTGPMTQHVMDEMYCHSAVAALENKDAMTLEQMNDIPADYQEATSGYAYLKTYAEVKRFVEKAGFPCVVLLAAEDPTKIDVDNDPLHVMRHSCVALGRNMFGEIIVWEKQNSSAPYRLMPLKWVYKDYEFHNEPDPDSGGKPRLMWGTRPLEII